MSRSNKARFRNSNRTPPPPAKSNKNLPTDYKPSLGSTIFGNIFTGMTFGAGSSMGHRAVDAVMGNRNSTNNEEVKFMPCEKIFEMYDNCLKNENNDCSYLSEMMRLKCSLN